MTISVFYEHVIEAASQENMSIPEVLCRIKQAGITGVELDRGRLAYDGKAEGYLKEAGISVHGLYQFFDFGYQHTKEDNKEGKALIDDAVRLGAQVLLIPGFIHEEDMDDEIRKEKKIHCENPGIFPIVSNMADVINDIASYARQNGVVISMEDFDDCHSPIATAEGLLWFMGKVNGLTVAFDTGNFLYSEEPVLPALEKLLPYVAQVHLKDRSLNVNDGEYKETIAGRKLYPTAVGSGCIPMEDIIRCFQDNGYDGNYAIEHFGSKHQLADMLHSVEYIKKILA